MDGAIPDGVVGLVGQARQHRYCTAFERRVLAEENGPLKARDGVLMTLIVILVVLWLLGMVTTYTLGGLLHILLVIAVILLLVRVIQGRPI
jgi:hypothetical protein